MADSRDDNLDWMTREPQSRTVSSLDTFYDLCKYLNNDYRVVMQETEDRIESGEIIYPAVVFWNEGQIYID